MEPVARLASAASSLKDVEMHAMRAALDTDPARPTALHFGREYKQLHRPKRACVDGEDSCYTSSETRKESRPKHIRAADGSHERLCALASAAEDLGIAISSTARSGHHRLIEDDDSENSDVDVDGSTISKERGNTDDAVEKTLMSMVKWNTPTEELSEFLHSHKISDQLRGRVVIHAATHSVRGLAESCLTNGSISQEDRGLALIRAAKNGAVNIFRALLASGPISDKDRERALIWTAKRGMSVRIIHALQASGTISKEAQDEATRLLNAHREAAIATDESAETTWSIRRSWATTGDDTVEKTLMSMVERNTPIGELSEFLSSHEISDQLRGRVVIYAATRLVSGLAEYFLTNGAISQEDRGLALIRAAKNGAVNIFRALLASGPISDKDRERALIWTAKRGMSVRIIHALQASGTISKEAQDEATRLLNAYRGAIATTTDESSEATLISRSGSRVKDRAITREESVVETNLMSMVKWNTPTEELREFLSSHEISNPIRGHAVICAATRGLTQITKQLLINGAISQEDRELALMRAANRSATGIIKILRASEAVSKET